MGLCLGAARIAPAYMYCPCGDIELVGQGAVVHPSVGCCSRTNCHIVLMDALVQFAEDACLKRFSLPPPVHGPREVGAATLGGGPWHCQDGPRRGGQGIIVRKHAARTCTTLAAFPDVRGSFKTLCRRTRKTKTQTVNAIRLSAQYQKIYIACLGKSESC